jgi:hypothetical protein
LQFCYYLSFEEDQVHCLNKLEFSSSNARMICTNLYWNWPANSGEDFFF